MDHSFIDEQQVAERYLTNSLSEEDFAAFSNHSAWCEECQDRLQLAKMWLAEQEKHAHRPQPQFSSPVETPMDRGVDQTRTAWAEAAPEIKVGPEIAGPESVSEPEPAEDPLFASTTLELVRLPPRTWQLPALVNMATALSVALEIIRGQQEQLNARANQRWRPEEIPPMARFVMQFEPWELAALGTLAAMLLMLMPATLFVWELRQILAQR